MTVDLNGLIIPFSFFVIDGLYNPVILGLNFLKRTKCTIHVETSTASFFDDLVVLSVRKSGEITAVLRTINNCKVPPSSEIVLPVRIPQYFSVAMGRAATSSAAVIEPYRGRCGRSDILVARIAVHTDVTI